MRDFWLVLRTHLKLTLRGATRNKRRGILGFALVALFFTAMGVAITYGAYQLFAYLAQAFAEQPGMSTAIAYNLLVGWGMVMILFVLTNSMTSIYATVYGSEDTGYLLATPLNPRSLLAARLTECVLTYVVIALPATFGPFLAYGLISSAGAMYYTIATLAYLAYLVSLVGIAAVFITVIVSFVPGNRLKQLLMMSGLVVGLVFVFAIQYLSVGLAHDSLGFLQRFAGFHIGGWPAWPFVWLARVTIGVASGEPNAFVYLVLLLTLAATLISGLIWFVARVYVRGWASLQEVDTRRRPARRRQAATGTVPPGRSVWASPFWAMARKEFFVTLRSPIHWYMVALGVILVGFQIFSLVMRGTPVHGRETLFVLGFTLVGAGIGAGVMAGSIISREGTSIGLVQTWPIRPATLFWAKVCVTLTLPLTLATIGLLAMSRVPDLGLTPVWHYVLLAWAVLPPIMIALATLDAFWPNFAFSAGLQPGAKKAGSTVIRLLIMVYSVFGLIPLLLATYGLPGYYEKVRWLSGMSLANVRVLAYGLFGLETLGVALILPRLAIGRIRRLYESQ